MIEGIINNVINNVINKNIKIQLQWKQNIRDTTYGTKRWYTKTCFGK